MGLANNECKPPEVRGSHPPELDTRRADICRFHSLMSMLAGHGRCYFLITWGHAASILLIASLPYREMYKLPPLEVSLIDKSVFSCEAPRALQAQAVLLSAQRFPFSFFAGPLCCLLRCSTFFGARRCSRRQNTCMSRRFIFNSMDDCEPRAIGRCSFSLDMGSFAHQLFLGHGHVLPHRAGLVDLLTRTKFPDLPAPAFARCTSLALTELPPD